MALAVYSGQTDSASMHRTSLCAKAHETQQDRHQNSQVGQHHTARVAAKCVCGGSELANDVCVMTAARDAVRTSDIARFLQYAGASTSVGG